MSPIPRITQATIRNWTDDVYFQRGLKYYEQGAIYDQRQQGMTLKSKCSGSQAPFYRQEADCVPEILVEKTTPDERVEIAKWTREVIPKGDSWSDGYHRAVLGKLLLDLEADTLDDEAYLKICRATGRLNDLIERLLGYLSLEFLFCR